MHNNSVEKYINLIQSFYVVFNVIDAESGESAE